MSTSFTYSNSQSFTVTHARYLASKVAADLKRIQRFYNSPSDQVIANYEAELIEYLKAGYLKQVTYGFKRYDNWIEPTIRYNANDLVGMSFTDDDPGRIAPSADVSSAFFTSYLEQNNTFFQLTPAEQEKFKAQLPVSRTIGDAPGMSGYLSQDKTYSSGGRSLDRSSLKSF